MKTRKIVAIILILIITCFILIFQLWPLVEPAVCKCGGCCEGCPADCKINLGWPLIYYYAGIQFNEDVSSFNSFNLVIDLSIWAILTALIYKFIYKH